jgi:transposase
MISIVSDARIFVFTGTTDMRKSFNGLCDLTQRFCENPIDANFYVFSNHYRNRLKILYWDGDDFVF